MPRALVTGADGFIGSHLVESPFQQGLEVRALCQYNAFNSSGWLDESGVRDEVEMVLGDVRGTGHRQTLLQKVNAVFHLAALIGIPHFHEASQNYVATNVEGLVNLCAPSVGANRPLCIKTSTREVHRTAFKGPIDEKRPLQAQSPHSASEIASDAMARSFGTAFGLQVVVTQPFNTYEPRQSAPPVILAATAHIANDCSHIQIGDTDATLDRNFGSEIVTRYGGS